MRWRSLFCGVALIVCGFSWSLLEFANCTRAASSGASVSPRVAQANTEVPDWCKALPRPEYKNLERVLANEPWFEVYKVAPGTFAIYEPHQAEETISYLIVGAKQAVLFDTGMGIGNIRKVVAQLTSRPVVVLNSHRTPPGP